MFPMSGDPRPLLDYAENGCNRGLKIPPKRGKVVIFYSLHAGALEKACHPLCYFSLCLLLFLFLLPSLSPFLSVPNFTVQSRPPLSPSGQITREQTIHPHLSSTNRQSPIANPFSRLVHAADVVNYRRRAAVWWSRRSQLACWVRRQGRRDKVGGEFLDHSQGGAPRALVIPHNRSRAMNGSSHDCY